MFPYYMFLYIQDPNSLRILPVLYTSYMRGSKSHMSFQILLPMPLVRIQPRSMPSKTNKKIVGS